MPPLRDLNELVEAARTMPGGSRVAIARCADAFVIKSAVYAHAQGLAEPIFIGDIDKTRETADSLGISLAGFRLVHRPDDQEAVAEAVRLFKIGEADLIMKGQVGTEVLLKAVLNKESGIPPKGILSHVAVFSPPGEHRLAILTDAAVNIKPTLQRKVEILKNALAVARALGIDPPKAAVLAATEKVNYPAMPATLDADLMAKMADQGAFGDAQVCGPLSLDLALSAKAVARKGYSCPAAGCADVLCAPDIESGNMLYKALNSLMGVDIAAVVVGSRAPLVLPSRGDSERSKFYSLALAVYLAGYPEPECPAS